MRNLKRVLSLALALVMMLGMMVIGANAAGFDDAAEIQYTEAVEVMSALKVFEGDGTGNFNPNGILTREQAAKIIAYMLLGADNAEKLNANNTIFKDVAAGRWSAGYISYCATVGILAGVGDGYFDPEGQLTGVAFGKMLLVALGYDAKIEGYVGSNWATNIATDMITAGIDVKGVTLSDPLTREQAAQMAFQALEADMVDYDNRGWEMTLTDGTTVVVGADKPESVLATHGEDYTVVDNPSDVNETTLQFCEKYFDSLTKDTSATDSYGRPGHEWINSGKSVILVLDTPVATYTGKVKADQVAADLSGYSVNVTRVGVANPIKTKVNNVLDQVSGDTLANVIRFTDVAANNVTDTLTFGTETVAEGIAGETNNGKVVEVYADRAKNITKIVEVEYAVAKVTGITAAKDKTVYTFSIGVSGTDFVDDNVRDTIKLYGDIAKGGYVTLVKTGTVLNVYPTTTVTGTQTSYTTVLNTITVDGQTYKVGTGVGKDTTNTNYVTTGSDFANGYKNAKYYIDQFGYVVATTAIASNEYVYIVAADVSIKTGVDGNSMNAEVRGVLADGTTAVYNVPVEKLTAARGIRVAGDWVVKNTEIKLTDEAAIASNKATAEGNAKSALQNKIFGYVLTDTGLVLEALPTFVTGLATTNTVYETSIDTLTIGKTDYTNKLADSNTQFVVYDSNKKSVSVYTGPDNLPSYFDGVVNDYDGVASVVKAVDADNALISVAFVVTSSGVSADAIDEYVYISTAKRTETLSNGRISYTYDGVKADGSVIPVTTQSALGGNGVYAYDANGKITNDLNTELGTSAVINATSGMTVVGNLVKVSGTYYQLTENTNVVYVNDTLVGNYDGEGGWIVLTVKNGSATNVIDTIYVTVDL